MFSNVRLMVSVIASIIGYVDDYEIYEVTLAIMNEVSNPESQSDFDFAGFNGLISYLMFMILYLQCNFYFKKFLPLREWSSIILTFVENERKYLEFVNEFMLNTYTFLLGHKPPRMPSFQQMLQLNPDIKVGDWYLFKRYTIELCEVTHVHNTSSIFLGVL
jgi:hypothetical protein